MEFVTSLMNGILQCRLVVFPAEDQFTRHIFTPHDGRGIYAEGNDHIIKAARCAMLAREQANLNQVGEETVSLVPVMTDPVFV